MKKAHSRTSLSNIHSETQKLQRQNANVLRSQSVCCLLSHMIVEFPNSRHMYALHTCFYYCVPPWYKVTVCHLSFYITTCGRDIGVSKVFPKKSCGQSLCLLRKIVARPEGSRLC